MRKIAYVHGFNVDLLSFEDVVLKLTDVINSNQAAHVVTINPEIIQSAKKNPKLKEIINSAEVVTPDGVGIKIALKMKGICQAQVTGVDLSLRMLDVCAEKSFPVALVGAKEEIITLAVQKIKEKNPNINIVYSHNGYFQEFDPIINDILSSAPKFVLCAMGSPRQEFFISELKKRGLNAVMIGVGGTFDVISGTVQLAPQIYRKMGLEWLYRTIKQPERFKRIFPTLPIFFFQSIIDTITSKK